MGRTHRTPSYLLVVSVGGSEEGEEILRASGCGSIMGAMRLAGERLASGRGMLPGHEWSIEVKITEEGWVEVETGSP